MKIKSFTDLHCWQEAHKLVVMVYEATRNFPPDERFGLTNQMRRAAISITSNIAEGFSRHSKKEKNQFYTIAIGSDTELQSQLLAARDLRFLAKEGFSGVASQTIVVNKLLNGLMKSSQDMRNLHT